MTAPAMLVAIDGPAGAGKSSVARRVAVALGLPLLDTGAIYRTLALVASRRGVSWDDGPALAELGRGLTITFGPLGAPEDRPKVWLGGDDITTAIRTPEISQGASKVSALPEVRAALLDIQRNAAASGCVAEGRDIGTVVLPHARHKFFLTADLHTRAMRRVAELAELAAAEGDPVPPVDVVEREVAERDARDSSRDTAPLRKADDAVLVDSSGMALDEVVARILAHIADAGPGPNRPPAAS
jgi:cytidylate kinase